MKTEIVLTLQPLTTTRPRLPVVMNPPGDCALGTAHARDWSPHARLLGLLAQPRRIWRRYPGRVLLAAVLLCGAMFLPRPAPDASANRPRPHPVLLVSAPPPAPAPTPPRWDSNVNALPRTGQFVRYYRMMVTAYTPINTRMEGGRYTVTRRDGRSVHGVAVDPDLIPLGSHLWIPGYGHAIADDIGGRIQGHHVDLRLQEGRRMGPWGVRHVCVYVLDDPRGPLSRLATSK